MWQRVLMWLRSRFRKPPELGVTYTPPSDTGPDTTDSEKTDPTVVPIERVVTPTPMTEGRMERPELKQGAKGPDVLTLQKLLVANGEGMTPDGDFGPGTAKAVSSFQQSYGLAVTGIADASTWRVLDRPAFGKDPTLQGLAMTPPTPLNGTSSVVQSWNQYGGLLLELSGRLGFDPALSIAVLLTESAGKGFASDGRMIIRFENHIFYSQWGKANPDVFNAHFKFDPNQRWLGHFWRPDAGEWQPLHTKTSGQNAEWAVLAFARTLADEAALRSISMGAPQVMGFNCLKIGLSSAREMFDTWSKGDRPQVLGLFDFIRSNHRMVRALRGNDLVGFARYYNGEGQAEVYGDHIDDNRKAAKAAGVP